MLVIPPPIPDEFLKLQQSYLDKNYHVGLGDRVFVFRLIYAVIPGRYIIEALPGYVVHVSYTAHVAEVETFYLDVTIGFDGSVNLKNGWWTNG